jgi:predicted DNA-binding transcriptional regulator YafY
MKEQHDRYDRLAVRLSVIISRLLAGHALILKTLADEFVSQSVHCSEIFSSA